MAKQGVATPRERFPEFRGTQAWPLCQLGDACELYQPETISSDTFSAHGRHLVYGAGGVIGRLDRFNHEHAEVIIGCRGVCGNASLTEPESWITGNAMVISPNEKGLSKQFLYHALCAADLSPVISGSAQPQITRQSLKRFLVAVPDDSAEQQKIADCLTSLDEVIAAQGRIVAALKAHKRGLMQQLFPRIGETRPRLRFPEFRNAAEWNTQPLGSLMTIGSSRRVHESDWTSSGVPFYRAREIVALSNREPISPLFISDSLYAEYVGYTGEIEEGQLLVTGVGSIGIPYLVRKFDRFYFKDGNIIWLKNGQADVLGDFLFRLFESEYVQAQIATMAGIGTVGTYTIENAKRTVAVFPSDKREQQRITDCLSSLDAEITAESNQLAALKTHKQGLMQQLFPAPEQNS